MPPSMKRIFVRAYAFGAYLCQNLRFLFIVRHSTSRRNTRFRSLSRAQSRDALHRACRQVGPNAKVLFVLGLCLSVVLPLSAHAEEVIRKFDVDAQLNGRQLTFTESIVYDFGDAERHGIIRFIPVSYERHGGSYRLRLQVEEVRRDAEVEPYKTTTHYGLFNFKIGDPNVTHTGSHTYQIRYTTDRALNFFPEHDELYWNVTGNEWQIPIEQASFILTAPGVRAEADLRVECFTGPFGSVAHGCDITYPRSDTIRIASNRVLMPGEGLTIVIGFPKGFIPEPTAVERAQMFVVDNGVLFFPIMALVIMFALWWRRGRDPKRGTIIPQYEPPEQLEPALIAAAVSNGDVAGAGVTATIIDLARRGYVHIRFGTEKRLLFGSKQIFTFVRQKEYGDELKSFERDILRGLFKEGTEQSLQDLKSSEFYKDVARFKQDVQRIVDKAGWFDANPGKTRGAFISIGIILAVVLSVFFASTPLGILSGVLTGLVIIIFGWFMPRRTMKGLRILEQIEGFKWFLSVTEKERLDFHNAPERTPEQFQTLLPYAIALEVEEKWAQQFASLMIPAPEWAEGVGNNLSTLILASHLSSLHTMAATSAYAAPSSAGSGGSGFSGGGSGGGFGGGGGGSW